MWICLSDSFLSIVSDRYNPDCLMVRARRPGDIEKLFPGYEGKYIEEADYAYRVSIPRKLVGEVIAEQLGEISYEKFKPSVEDPDLHHAYLDIWHIMYRLQLNIHGMINKWHR
jgi:hypothetical protein